MYGTPVYLTLEERDRLLALDLRVFPRLERHRDMFIFQSLVGCRVGDLYRLTSDNIRDGFLEYCPPQDYRPGRQCIWSRHVPCAAERQGTRPSRQI